MLQTILGANGQIGTEVARALRRSHPSRLRLVSRSVRKVHDDDELRPADLLDAAQTAEAVAGSDVVYFTAGLPPNTALWQRQFPPMLRNAIEACRLHGARFVYFDNTYMLPQDGTVLTETTAFAPSGPKGRVRAEMAKMVLQEIERGQIKAAICRAPEFYGPEHTQSFTNAMVVERIRAGRRALVPVRDDTRRTLIWTPDASAAMAAIGNSLDAFGQTWNLPCDDAGPTYREFVGWASAAFGRNAGYRILRKMPLQLLGLVSKPIRELGELLPRYAYDNRFDSSKFKRSFPECVVTSYQQGLKTLAEEPQP